MNGLENQPITIQEYREKLKKKTCNIKELSVILGVSEAKARRITHIGRSTSYTLWALISQCIR